jgi:DNA-binding MarR family transcriptional regulator
MYRIWIVAGIIVIAGLVGGWAGYLLDPASSNDPNTRTKIEIRKRYLLLGVIAAGCVPLFLSLVKSAIIDTIFGSNNKNGVEIIPFAEYLIFTGFCLIAALSARNFLDTVSRQVLRDVQRATEKAMQAEAKASEAGERAAVVSDLFDEALEKDAPSPQQALTEAASQLPPGATIPEISPAERKALNAMMKMSYRTATGIAQEVGIQRNQVGELLDALASKRLVERTTSPTTHGPRWRITATGVRALNAPEKT